MVQQSDQATLDQLQTLAALATAKGLPVDPDGFNYDFNLSDQRQSPFDFGVVGDFTTELMRMRLNAYRQFRYFNNDIFDNGGYETLYPSSPQMLVSGPHTITPVPANVGLKTAPLARTQGNISYTGQIPTFAENKYAFADVNSTVTTTVDFKDVLFFPTNPIQDNADNGAEKKPFEWKQILGGALLNLDFQIIFYVRNQTGANTIQLFGADAADFQLTVLGSFISGGTVVSYVALQRTGAENTDRSFSVGIKSDNTTEIIDRIDSVTLSGATYTTHCLMTRNDSDAEPFPILNGSFAGKIITPPDMAKIKIVPIGAAYNLSIGDYIWQTDTPVGGPAIRYCGNQAVITVGASNPNLGIWIAKTYPVQELNFYNSTDFNVPSFNKPAFHSTINAPKIGSISRACEYMLPTFPLKRWTNQIAPFLFDTQCDISGAVIVEVSIRRLPVPLDGHATVLWEKKAADMAALDVHFGTVTGAGFLQFDTITIPPQIGGVEREVFYLANPYFQDQRNHFQLVYACSEEVFIQAKFHGAIATNTGYILAYDQAPAVQQSVGFVVDQPILAAHFNDTEALLNLL